MIFILFWLKLCARFVLRHAHYFFIILSQPFHHFRVFTMLCELSIQLSCPFSSSLVFVCMVWLSFSEAFLRMRTLLQSSRSQQGPSTDLYSIRLFDSIGFYLILFDPFNYFKCLAMLETCRAFWFCIFTASHFTAVWESYAETFRCESELGKHALFQQSLARSLLQNNRSMSPCHEWIEWQMQQMLLSLARCNDFIPRFKRCSFQYLIWARCHEGEHRGWNHFRKEHAERFEGPFAYSWCNWKVQETLWALVLV